MKDKKYNYDAQEKVVEALWNLLRDNNRKPHNGSVIEPDGLGNTSANMEVVGDALEVIMSTFGYEVQPTD